MSDAVPSASLFRWLAIAVFIALPALLATLTVLNVTRHSELQLQAAITEQQLQRFRQRSALIEASDDASADLSPLYLDAASASLAGAELQQFLSRQAAAAFGRVIETVIVEPGPEAAPGTITANLTVDIDNDGLFRLLYNLETGLPFLYVETLSVRRLGSVEEGATDDVLRVDLSIEGHWRPPAG